MAVELTFYPKSVTFNAVTWDNSNGGPTALRYEDSASELETRVADDFYPRSTEMVDATATATLTLTEFVPGDLSIGDKSNLAMTLSTESSTAVKTMYNMVYRGASGTQDRAVEGTVDLFFTFESDDGQNDPFTSPLP